MLRVALLAAFVFAPLGANAAKSKKKVEVPDDGLPSVEEVAIQVKAVYDELSQTSDPLVRRAVFQGRLDLDDEARVTAISTGMKESDWAIRGEALALALGTAPKKLRRQWKPLRKAAEEQLTKLLESGEVEDRTRGVALLEAHYKSKVQLKWLLKAAKIGTPDAREGARAALIARGGKVAWKVISAGMAEEPESREYKQALEALRNFAHPLALKWALKRLHQDDDLGDLARGLLVEMSDKRAVKKMNKVLKREYEKSADFEKRLRIASVLGRRGDRSVARTLLAGLRYQKKEFRIYTWRGLLGVHDLVVLGKVRAFVLANEKDAEADAAYAWLVAWARANAEPKVFEVLQDAARSDRRPLRLRGMRALAELKHRASVALFEAAMGEGQKEVRLAGAEGLAAVARPGDEKRIHGFLRKEPDADVKIALVKGLARIGTPEIIAPLQYVMMAPHRALKLEAVQAIAATGSPKATIPLSLLKRDADIDVRFIVWHNLLKLRPRETVPEMRAALTWMTGEQLDKLGADKKVPIESLELAAQRGNDEQRTFAISALNARGGQAATRLLGLVESPHADTAAASLDALAKLRGDKSVPTYRKALKSKHGPVRAAGYAAIGRFGPRALLETVLGGMADREPLARARAAAASVVLAAREPEPT